MENHLFGVKQLCIALLCIFASCNGLTTSYAGDTDLYPLSTCTDGFLQYNESTCVKVYTSEVTYDTAEALCAKDGGYLVAPNTPTFNSWLTNMIQIENIHQCWIGISRQYGWDYPRQFSNGLPIRWSKWKLGTSLSKPGIKYCVYMKRQGFWIVGECGAKRRFMCQKRADCNPGFFGMKCDQQCHCLGEPCDFYTGVCKYGCLKGWIGKKCNIAKSLTEATYYCINSKEDGKYMLLRILPKGTHFSDIYGLNSDGEAVENCHYAQFEVDRVNGHVSRKVYVDGNDTCGATQDQESNIYKWQFYLEEIKGVLSEGDEVLTITCDFNDADKLSLDKTVQVSGKVKANTRELNVTEEIITMDVINPFSKKSLPDISIGTNVALQISLKEKEGLSAKGISVFGCKAFNSDATIVKKLTDSNGCTLSSSTVKMRKGNGRDVISDPFPMFTFPDSTSVSFSCDYEYCFLPNELKCTDRCEYKSEQHRRKRNIETRPKSVSVSVRIISKQVGPQDEVEKKVDQALKWENLINHLSWTVQLIVIVLVFCCVLFVLIQNLRHLGVTGNSQHEKI